MINDMIKSDYFDKGTDFSVTDFTKNDYQLWVSKNFPKDDKPQSFKPWVGQLIHKASYDTPETNVIKEFSGTFEFAGVTIGGSIDRMQFLQEGENAWQIEDIKSQGLYPAKKAFKEPPEYWITQLSIYRYMMTEDYGFPVLDHGIIHQYVMSHQKNKDGMEEYNRLIIKLRDYEEVENLMACKISMAQDIIPPVVDCEQSWQCGYCDYTTNCPAINQSF